MTIEVNGRVIIRTSPAFAPPPITLQPGLPTLLTADQLAPYLDVANLDFVSYSRASYQQTKALPEGAYKICFQAFDFRRREVSLSDVNQGCSFYYLSKSEPPLVNQPACESKIPKQEPQQLIFSWLARQTASPNAAQETEYEFSLLNVVWLIRGCGWMKFLRPWPVSVLSSRNLPLTTERLRRLPVPEAYHSGPGDVFFRRPPVFQEWKATG
jgi:hypothetical protein